MSQTPDPKHQPYPQQQPPYPQQYPPWNYGPPYYQPYPPPKKDDKKILTMVIIVIIVIFVLPTVLAAILYFVVIGLAPTDFPGSQAPTGTWGAKTIISPTSVWVDFGNINPEQMPEDIEIILVRNWTIQGTYMFSSNDDGVLARAYGTDVGTLFYEDLADNRRINIGDRLEITNLYPQSDYQLVMIYAWTGNQITSTTFSTH